MVTPKRRHLAHVVDNTNGPTLEAVSKLLMEGDNLDFYEEEVNQDQASNLIAAFTDILIEEVDNRALDTKP